LIGVFTLGTVEVKVLSPVLGNGKRCRRLLKMY